MRISGNIPFDQETLGLLNPFLDFATECCLKKTAFSVPRFVTGSLTCNFMIGTLAPVYDQSGRTYAALKHIFEKHAPPDKVMKETFISLCGPKSKGIKFSANNYLEKDCQRQHVVLYGSGSLSVFDKRGEVYKVKYRQGDVIDITDRLDTYEYVSVPDKTAIHLVTYWADPNAPPVWDLHARFKRLE